MTENTNKSPFFSPHEEAKKASMSGVLTGNSKSMKKTFHYDWNVIDDKEFKQRILNVFSQVASALVNTLGPYGATTLIEKFGDMHITKDGWAVLKKIHFTEDINNHILQLLFNISAQVVIKVGDGSTSSIVAADSIFNNLDKWDKLKTIRSRDLMDTVSRCVGMVSEIVLTDSIKIDPTKDTEFDDIYKLAMISTNGNQEVSEIIRHIYKVTGNPSIEFNKSKTSKTDFEIVDGYKCMITYLDAIFATNDNGICEINKPMLLMFDHKLEAVHLEKIIQEAIQQALAEGRRLVVIAPHYDKQLMGIIARITNTEFKSNQMCTTVYTRVSLLNKVTTEYFNDLCMMSGGMMITESAATDLIEGTTTYDQYLGEVDKISIGDKTSLFTGFFKRNEDEFQRYTNDAFSKYKKVEETHSQQGIVNSELYDLKQRISKLRGRMGIVSVGGYSSLEKDSNFDLVEDAVKACESAFNYGYNVGGNLIIPIAIQKLLALDVDLSETDKIILTIFDTAFREVFAKVLRNKYTLATDEFITELVDGCVDRKQCWDLVKEEFSDNIINSCYTDIEILKASTSIIALLISSNQYISILPSPAN